jgi:hypothetical protein
VVQLDELEALSEFDSEGPSVQKERKESRRIDTSIGRRPPHASPQTATRAGSPWRPARFDVAERPDRESTSPAAGRILQLIDDRWYTPASGAPFLGYSRARSRRRRGAVAKAILVAILAVSVGFTVAATLDRVRNTLAPQPFVQSPVEDELPTTANAAAVSSDPGNLNGGWTLTSRVPSNSHDAPRLATIGYRFRLKQEGVRVSGTGYRAMENGRIIPLRQRSPITLEGKLDGRRLELLFAELGARGTSGGALVLRVADDASLRGTFWNDATQSKGNALATRVAP